MLDVEPFLLPEPIEVTRERRDASTAATAERIVRRFFDACESPEKRVRAERLLRRGARNALRGRRRYRMINSLVANRMSRLAGIDSRARTTQLITAHLLGFAYIRYVFKLEPIASMPIDELIEWSVPVVTYYLTDHDAGADLLEADPLAGLADFDPSGSRPASGHQ